MPNALYGKGRQKFAEGSIHWLTDDIKVILVDMADYPDFNIDTNEFLSDVPVLARVKVSGAFDPDFKTATLGVCDAADVTLSTVTGDVCEALVIFKDTGEPTTSPLIAYIVDATGLPITPNGGDIIIQWDSGANKIFKL